MAYSITERCVNCFACEAVCPKHAVREAMPVFVINPKACTECEGEFADPQCASICPVEGAILNGSGEAVNPPGSLTGIPAQLSPGLEASDPLLRRRPLILTPEACVSGFDAPALLGLGIALPPSDDLETCPRKEGEIRDDPNSHSYTTP